MGIFKIGLTEKSEKKQQETTLPIQHWRFKGYFPSAFPLNTVSYNITALLTNACDQKIQIHE